MEPLAAIYATAGYLEHMRGHDLRETRVQIEYFARQWREVGFSHWAVEEPRTRRLIGRIGLIRHYDWPLAEAPVEAGWVLDPNWWGRGLATEGGLASLEVWREHLPQERQLISVTRPDNSRSRAVMDRLGLAYRGTTFWHGREVVWYATERT